MASMLTRRMAIAEMGKAGMAVVVFGVAACAEEAGQTTTTTTPTTTSVATTTSTGATSTTSPSSPDMVTVGRVDLDFVSAYIVHRAGEAALVDTGVPESEAQIEAVLGQLGLGWGSVGHVILTHKHPDHVGSVTGVMERAAEASIYAGEADIPFIDSAVTPQPVGDGDRVFDLDIIATPGHTLGHVSVHDPASGFLVAGDALNGPGSGAEIPAGLQVAGSRPEFTEDEAAAIDSVRRLAGLEFEMVYFGHGDPLLSGGSGAVAELAATLG